ncbi:MAG: TorF family putative porin [Xanthobacteraceae bacterium]|nr:TorF family putative porin [Xanthobacteraceae bacterium]
MSRSVRQDCRHRATGNGDHRRQALAAAALACVGFAGLAVAEARAQAVAQTPSYAAPGAINLGGRGWSGSESRQAVPESAKSQLEFAIRGGLTSDYVYRGVTLSDRKPAAGAAIEATYNVLYAGVTVASVRLPTQPAAEISISGGIRPTLGPVELDLGVTYYRYPGEAPSAESNGINYWEAALRAGTKLGEAVRIAGGFAYSPNVSNTGAWSSYAAAGLGYDVPARFLPKDIGVSFTAAAGYSWFGRQHEDLGGFPLPAYLNWQAGVTVTYKMLNLDLRYHDTNLSKENCFVFTGDPNAQPGGRPDPLTNPDGLTSRWCGAAFVAKLWFALN